MACLQREQDPYPSLTALVGHNLVQDVLRQIEEIARNVLD